MNALDQHPREGGEEEVVEEAGHGRAKSGVLGCVETENQKDFGAQETDAKVPVNRGSVAS